MRTAETPKDIKRAGMETAAITVPAVAVRETAAVDRETIKQVNPSASKLH